MEPTKPPGHTCPGIDDARAAVRQMARLLREGGVTERSDFEALVDSAHAALERVRDENKEMRRTYIEAMAFRHIANEAIALVHSGYDGCIAGPEVEPLIRAITAYERRKGRQNVAQGLRPDDCRAPRSHRQRRHG